MANDMSDNNAELYTFPDNAPRATDVSVTINGQPIFVYDTKVAAIVSFGVHGQTEIRIERKTPFSTCIVRPLAAGITPEIQEQTVSISISKPTLLSVEFDDIDRPVFVFADPADAVVPVGPHVQTFRAGQIHEAGRIDVKDGGTVYLEGGAVVQGHIRADGVNDIKILGPGILDGSHHREKQCQSVVINGCENVEIRDLAIIDSHGWTLHLRQNRNVRIDNLKEVCWRGNSDGIDINACRDVHVTNSFLRNNDDCIAVKSSEPGANLPTENIVVEKTVMWNGIPGNAMEIGFELVDTVVRDVTFRDCDIIRVEAGAAFSIHNGDNALVENVLFENIRVEDARDEFADMYVGLSIYSVDSPKEYYRMNPQRTRVPKELQDAESGNNCDQWIMPPAKEAYAKRRGHIRNVTFRKIYFFPPAGNYLPDSLFMGYDVEHLVEDVSFEDVFVDGARLNAWPDGKVKTRHVRNVQFK